MKKTYLILFSMLTFSSLISFSQNLAKNGSFEDTVTCPDGFGQINKAAGWYSYGNSPDYFHSCSPWNTSSIPENDYGFQYAADGNAYCGIISFAIGGLKGREFIGQKLESPLIVGQKYYASFKASFSMNPYETCCAVKDTFEKGLLIINIKTENQQFYYKLLKL